jgi:two-component system sensor histidine kinase KdpD
MTDDLKNPDGRHYLKSTLATKKSREIAQDFGWLTVIALSTWLIATALQPIIGYMAVGIIFLLAVSLAGLFLSRAAVLALAFAFAFIHNFFFIPPRLTFTVSNPEDFMLLLMLFVAAAVVGHLTTRLANKERVLRSREHRTMILYNLAKEIASAQSVDEILERARTLLKEALHVDVLLLLSKNSDAGRGTETLSAAEHTYVPIIGRSGVLGVAGFAQSKANPELSTDQLTLIDALLHQIASGIERETYHDRVKTLLVFEETQKLYKSLMDCVSHELKTPLAAIKGSASAIVDPMTSSNKEAVDFLGHQILEASERLQHLVENLLDMTRIESGLMQAKRIVCDVNDIISTSIREVDHLRGVHRVQIKIAESTPLVTCDPVLANQALANIIHNAFVYTPSDSVIEISAQQGVHGDIEILVRDHGPGLPRDNPAKVFNKFFRADQNHAGGVGLGLAVTKGFIESQGGSIEASNHPDGGALFTLHLPRGDVT